VYGQVQSQGSRGDKCPSHLSKFLFTPCDFFFLIYLLLTFNHSLRGKLFFRMTEIYDSSH